MTYRISDHCSRMVKVALPVFFLMAVLFACAFRGTIEAAETEQSAEIAGMSRMEQALWGLNP
ncbi:hypothetical protein JXA80_08510 [bacterium]|nr:hypothetical protein [candidate division CSSED10-310 bacterium]